MIKEQEKRIREFKVEGDYTITENTRIGFNSYIGGDLVVDGCVLIVEELLYMGGTITCLNGGKVMRDGVVFANENGIINYKSY